MRIMVTIALEIIGSAIVWRLIRATDYELLNFDKCAPRRAGGNNSTTSTQTP